MLASLLGTAVLDGVKDDEHIFETGVIDSLMLVELVDAFETQLGVPVKSQDLAPENFESVAAMAAYVTRERGG